MKTESTIQPKPITIERIDDIVHVVLAENVVSNMRDDTQMYEYDMSMVITNVAQYEANKKRTFAQWKPMVKEATYDGCVMTDNGLYPIAQIVNGKRIVLNELQTKAIVESVAWEKSEPIEIISEISIEKDVKT